VAVSLRREGPTLTVEVTDDGVGFDPARAEAVAASAEAGTFGLFSIRERLRYLGGRLDVRSAPGEGAIVTLCVPLANEEGGVS
jgi:signal transduction histidine kinase